MELLLPDILTPDEISHILCYAEASFHHEDDGHHINCKPNYLPKVADVAFTRMQPHLPSRFGGVDPWMKLYRLGDNARVKGIVFPHEDQDFVTPNGQRATWSVLCYLGGDYEGGETVFESTRVIAHPEPGSALVFPHAVTHEGREVTKGNKYILKTDLYE